MVAPVTGPYSKLSKQNTPSGGFIWDKNTTWYRQKRPFTLPLPFDMTLRETIVLRDYRANPNTSANTSLTIGFAANESTRAYNQAYARFVQSAQDTAQWAANIAEGRKAIDSIARRAATLTRFTRTVARGDFYGASIQLGLTEAPRKVSRKKSLADNWLEYHFGWEPLVKDIGASLEIAIDPYFPKKVRASGRDVYNRRGYNITSPSGNTSYRRKEVYTIDDVCSMGAYVSVRNPNVALLSQLGFINPLSVAWELVPFSFVVDWFGNVGQVLGSMTDLAGLDLSNSWYTHKQTNMNTESWRYGTFQVPTGHKTGEVFLLEGIKCVHVRRRTGIPAPSFALKSFHGFSPVRGLTAISLLLQGLK